MSKKMFLTKVGGAVSPYLANLVAYYPFNTNSNDFSGNINNGSDTSISYANAGKVGNSATFNGSSSKVTIPQSTDFDFSNITNDLPFSISFWFNSSSINKLQWIASKRTASGKAQWEIRLSSSFLELALYTTENNTINIRNQNTLLSNTWYLATFTYDGSGSISGVETYINGVVGSTPTRTTIGTYTKMPIHSQNTVIGVAEFVALAFYDGKLDEFAVWKNRIITQIEALDIYNKGVLGQTLI